MLNIYVSVSLLKLRLIADQIYFYLVSLAIFIIFNFVVSCLNIYRKRNLENDGKLLCFY